MFKVLRHIDKIAPKYRHAIFFTLGLVIIFAALNDFADDLKNNLPWTHFLSEIVILGLILALIFISWLSHKAFKLRYDQLVQRLKKAHDENLKSQKRSSSLSQGLTRVIDQQFSDWKFSKAEQEIAYLLIKGFSLKEISLHRGTSESTVRQQSQNLYSKCGLGGRTELSAFFLEDLLGPSNSPQKN